VQKALPLLKDGGSIILNGSLASVKGTAAFGVYTASKAAIRSFVRTWIYRSEGPSYPLKRC
jgi:NAD(P)-dependent dehydrogenase (short-subunit alcohol dehydrogenase family)